MADAGFKRSHGCSVWVSHLSAQHLCRRLSLSVGTTESRKPLVPIASAGYGCVGCLVYRCQTPLCLIYFLNYSPLVCGQFDLLCKKNSNLGGNCLSDLISILLISRTCFSYQKKVDIGKCLLPTEHSIWAGAMGDILCVTGCKGSVTPKHVGKSLTSRKAMCKPQWVSIPKFLLINVYISKSVKTHWAYFK